MEQQNRQGGKRRCTHLRHMRGPSLSVYQCASRLTAKNPDHELYATNITIGEAVGYGARTVGAAKRALAQAGWFESLGGNRGSGQDGRFEPNRYCVLTHEQWAKAHPGQCLGQSDRGISEPQRSEAAAGTERGGSSSADRSGPNVHQSLKGSIERKKESSPSAKATPSRTSSKKKETTQAGDDPRYQVVLQFYCAEFQRRHSDTQAPLDGSDRKALKSLLTQQPKVSAKTILGWLRNGFDSTRPYPLQDGFRLREFCAHYGKYLHGPLLRGSTEDEVRGNYPTLEKVRPKRR
jgi:hypothetical protein